MNTFVAVFEDQRFAIKRASFDDFQKLHQVLESKLDRGCSLLLQIKFKSILDDEDMNIIDDESLVDFLNQLEQENLGRSTRY